MGAEARSAGGDGGGTDDRDVVVEHLRRHPQASLIELEEAVRRRRPDADGDALLQALDAMEREGALIRRDHLYALAPWLRDGAAPPA